MAYVYRHIRLDTEQVFYIGIGVGYRCNQKHGRSQFWHRVVKKHGYRIEIMIDDLTWEEACEKEKEFIKLYGRRDKGKGTLANLTDGGDGMLGYVASEESRAKISKAKKGINPRPPGWKMPQSGIEKMRIANKGHKRCVGRILKDSTKEKLRQAALNQKNKGTEKKPVVYLDKYSNFISEYESVKEAARLTGEFAQTIMGSIKRKTHYGNYWMLKTDYDKRKYKYEQAILKFRNEL